MGNKSGNTGGKTVMAGVRPGLSQNTTISHFTTMKEEKRSLAHYAVRRKQSNSVQIHTCFGRCGVQLHRYRCAANGAVRSYAYRNCVKSGEARCPIARTDWIFTGSVRNPNLPQCEELIQLHFSIKGRSINLQGSGGFGDIIVHHLECVRQCLTFDFFKRQDLR